MSTNIIQEYLDFLQKSYLSFFKIMLRHRYSKELCSMFLDRYFLVRYYDETNYSNIKDFTERLNKELIDVLDSFDENANQNILKNIVALFAYIMYFDDICLVEKEGELIEYIASSDIVKIDEREHLAECLRTWYVGFKCDKSTFEEAFLSRDFSINEKRLYRTLYSVELKHNVKISNLYSEYAIEKVYTSGIVNEDKSFITYILLSFLVLNNAINLDFSKKYVVELPATLFEKDKKLERLINILNSTLAKKHIFMRLLYSDYIKYKDLIDKYISEGYSFILELDSSFSGNTMELILFPYLLVHKESTELEIIMKKKEHIRSKIIKI